MPEAPVLEPPEQQLPTRPSLRTSRTARVALVCLVQLVILVAAVFGQLSARLTGEEYLVRVAPIDPIDPFRGAYVALGYPDLVAPGRPTDPDERDRGTFYVPLIERGEVWVGGDLVQARPEGASIRCEEREWQLRCGIESYFLPQAEAKAVETAVGAGTTLARIKVDSAGHATVVELLPGAGEPLPLPGVSPSSEPVPQPAEPGVSPTG